MSIKKVLASICATALVAGFSASVSAETILLSIPTNFGKGADTEIREEETDTGFSGYAGRNRGGNTVEVGTRSRSKVSGALVDSTFNKTNSSAQYMKFDISQLPVSSDPYWNGKTVWFRANTVGNWRAYNNEANALPVAIPRTEFVWRLRALNPSGTYSTAQTDQNGNNYTASEYKYDWTEGTGTGAAADVTGITAYNAPGIRPFCKTAACTTTNGNTLGFFDEFDSNVLDLGKVPMPADTGSNNNLPGGTPLTYKDPLGDLTQLIKNARDLGLDTITLIGHSGPDGTNFQSQPLAFLSGQNQIIAPSERVTVLTANDNLTGAFSPRLLIVPEPTSFVLLSIVGLVGLAVRRRAQG